MKKYKTQNICPIIVGGCAVTKCVSSKKLDIIPISDIDIIFHVKNPSIPESLELARQYRSAFLENVLNDPTFTLFTTTNNLTIVKYIPEWERTKAVQLVRLLYFEDGKKHVILDTTIQSHQVNKFLKHKIPVQKIDDKYFAQCAYMKLDTVRLILHYEYTLKTIKPHQHTSASLSRYRKYFLKYALLFKLYKQIPTIKNISTMADADAFIGWLKTTSAFRKVEADLRTKLPDPELDVVIV